jgi:hypothetical protein
MDFYLKLKKKSMVMRVYIATALVLSTVYASSPKPQAYWLPPAMGATPDAPPLDPHEGVNNVPPNFSSQQQSTFFFF